MEHNLTGVHLLTDEIYAQYGGDTGTDEFWQREIAYDVAETTAQQFIGTFLVPNQVVVYYDFPIKQNRVLLRYWPVISIDAIEFLYDGNCDCSESANIDGCAIIRDDYRAIIDLRSCDCAQRSCSHGSISFNKAKITYTAGHQNLTLDKKAMFGLATAAKIYHEQLVDPYGAEGGIGDPALSNFSDNGHNETRTKEAVRDTPFGGSPTANYAARMLKHLKNHRPLGLRQNRV